MITQFDKIVKGITIEDVANYFCDATACCTECKIYEFCHEGPVLRDCFDTWRDWLKSEVKDNE